MSKVLIRAQRAGQAFRFAFVGAVYLASYLASQTAQSAEPPGYLSSIVREAFAVREFSDIDLPQSSVRAVHVCGKGYLWAGTREGLVQYKSGQQKIWQQTTDGVTGLPSGMINNIYEDPQGNIWVGTARGVAILAADDDQFRVVMQSKNDREAPLNIVSIVPLGDKLYAVSGTGELLSLSRSGATPLLARAESRSGKIEPLTDHSPTSATSADGDLFISTVSNGIYRIHPGAEAYEIVDLLVPGAPIVDVSQSGDKLLYLHRNEGLNWLLTETGEKLGSIDPLSNDNQGYYRAMNARSERSAWFGAGPNVVRVRGDKSDIVRLPGRGDEIRSITVDRAGNIWVGTYYGLFYGLDTDFSTYRTAAAYDSGFISSVAAVDDRLFIGGQNLWAGQTDGTRFEELATWLNEHGESGLRLNPLAEGQDPVSALAATESLLLVGYFDGGLDVIDMGSRKVAQVSELHLSDRDAPSIGVSSFAKVSENSWLATLYFNGLIKVTVKQTDDVPEVGLQLLNDEQQLIGVYRLAENRFLVVGERGLSSAVYQDSGVLDIVPFDALPPGIVFAVEPDGAGGAFLGVETAGVFHLSAQMFDAGRYAPTPVATAQRFLENRTVWHLLLDEGDQLWATTNNGVYVFDLPRDKLVSHLTYADGLPSDEFEYGPNASMRLSTGEKIFVSTRGPINFEQPVQPRDKQISLAWTDITADGRSILDQVESGAVQRLTLPFAAVSEGVVVFEYGYDDHVKALDATYAISFNSGETWLPGGMPRVAMSGQQEWGTVGLDIAMLNSTGDVLSEPLKIEVDVAPPVYMLWRIDLRIATPLLLSMTLILFLTHRAAQRRQRAAVAEAERRRQIIEAEMRGRLSEKEILLREIHHRVGNILSNFASNVRTMKRQARTEETQQTLEHLNARIKVQSAVHMLLQRSDSTAINVANMIRQVAAGARDFMGQDDNFRVDCELEDVYMTYSKAQYLGLIVNELLTNTYKHAKAHNNGLLARIRVQLQNDGTLLFDYKDFGVGPSSEEITEALSAGRNGPAGGLTQVVAMARELKGEPELSGEWGMSLRFSMPARLIHKRTSGTVDS